MIPQCEEEEWKNIQFSLRYIINIVSLTLNVSRINNRHISHYMKEFFFIRCINQEEEKVKKIV